MARFMRNSAMVNVWLWDLIDPQYSADPTPDLVAEALDGRFFYASLRGPVPLSGDAHASTGLMVLEGLDHGQSWAVRGIARINNIDAGDVQRADAHPVRVRRLGGRG